MSKDTVGFGIIGCGVIGPWHAFGTTHADNARLVAVCDVEEEKARKIAAENGDPRVYTDHLRLLEDPEVDAVCVCVPSGLHSTIGIDAAKAGKHVLSEKPIDVTLENIDALIAACDKAGVKLGCIFQRRTSPTMNAVREAVQSGKIGKLVLADAYLKYYRSQEYYDSAGWRGTWELDGGGALMNQGVHCVDLMRWIAGDPVSVFAHAEHLARNIEVEDTSVAVLKYANGAIGVIEGTTSVYKGMNHRLEFHGETGNILIDGEKVVRFDTADGPVDLEQFGAAENQSATADPKAIGMEGHRKQVEDFASAVIDNHDPMVTGTSARGAVELILGIYKSSQTGQMVKFPL